MSAPTPHQFLLAMAKVDLTAAEMAVLCYLASFTVAAPPWTEEWVVGAPLRVIADETGLHYGTVRTVLGGDRRPATDKNPARSRPGLIERGAVVCWSKGRGQSEAVFSIRGDLEEWATGWRPATRKTDPVSLREVLLELRDAGCRAPWVSAQPSFFRATQVARQGRRRQTVARWLPMIRRKGKVVCRATQDARQIDDLDATQDGASVLPFPLTPPFLLNPSDSAVRGQREQQQQTELRTEDEPPQATEILVAIEAVIGRKLFDSARFHPRSQIVHAWCDSQPADVGFVVDELRRNRSRFGPDKWQQAIDLAVTALERGPVPLRSEEIDCGQCVKGWVEVDQDGAGVAMAPCPSCRPGG